MTPMTFWQRLHVRWWDFKWAWGARICARRNHLWRVMPPSDDYDNRTFEVCRRCNAIWQHEVSE
jgi:hypothetical protein